MSTKETHKVTLMSVTAADAKNPTIHVKTIGRNDPCPWLANSGQFRKVNRKTVTKINGQEVFL